MTVTGSGTKRAAKTAGVRDVARLAGVSTGTVSKVLNRADGVTEATRGKVEDAISKLGFVPSRAAAQLRSGRSGLVAVIVPDVGNPFWGDVLRGIESVLDASGSNLVVSSSHQDPDRERHLIRHTQSLGVDGLLVAPVGNIIEGLEAMQERGTQVVVLDRYVPESRLPSVSVDDVKGAELAVTHLLEVGHRSIVMVNGPTSVSWCADRRAGAERAILGAHDLDRPPSLVHVEVADLTVAEGEKSVERILNDAPSSTGVFCANDLVALGVLRGLIERGVRVPADMALAGYDDVEFAAALFPPLTSVRQPPFEMGESAAGMLVDPDPDGEDHHVRFTPELVIRSSSDSGVSG